MGNLVLKSIMERRSIRQYSTKKIEPQYVEDLVNAALISPSSMNLQPWHVSVIQNQGTILKLEQDIVDYFKKNGPTNMANGITERGNKIFYNAPLVFVISAKDQNSLLDVGIVAQSINLAAFSLGLNSVTLGLPRVAFLGDSGDKWRKELQFPEGYGYGIAVAVGYGIEKGKDREIDKTKVSFIN